MNDKAEKIIHKLHGSGHVFGSFVRYAKDWFDSHKDTTDCKDMLEYINTMSEAAKRMNELLDQLEKILK